MTEAHGGVTGGQYVGKSTAQKILRAGLWWPIVHKDAKEFRQECDVHQRKGIPSRRYKMSLVTHVTLQAFDKWAIEFVGPISPPGKKTGARYIIANTDYLTRCDEAQPVKDCSA